MSQNQLTATWLQIGGVPVNGTSMGATLTSDWVPISFSDNVAIQVKWTGTPTGVFTVERSLDPTNLGPDVITVTPSITAPSGSPGGDYIEINQCTAGFIRLVYTYASGAGVLLAKVAAKAV